METEIWKRIPGNPEYEVSNVGRVRYNHKLMMYILSLHNDANGYTTVRLNKRNLKVRSRVDIIVLSVFVGQKPKNAEVVHENGDKYDNRLENLYWTAKK